MPSARPVFGGASSTRPVSHGRASTAINDSRQAHWRLGHDTRTDACLTTSPPVKRNFCPSLIWQNSGLKRQVHYFIGAVLLSGCCHTKHTALSVSHFAVQTNAIVNNGSCFYGISSLVPLHCEASRSGFLASAWKSPLLRCTCAKARPPT